MTTWSGNARMATITGGGVSGTGSLEGNVEPKT
jgi:hypothetical protein